MICYNYYHTRKLSINSTFRIDFRSKNPDSSNKSFLNVQYSPVTCLMFGDRFWKWDNPRWPPKYASSNLLWRLSYECLVTFLSPHSLWETKHHQQSLQQHSRLARLPCLQVCPFFVCHLHKHKQVIFYILLSALVQVLRVTSKRS